MKGILHHVSGRLHRKLFFGFGATIFATFLILGFVMHGLSSALPSPWEAEVQRVGHFLTKRFAAVWATPEARDALAASIGDELHVRVELEDLGGAKLGSYGPDCGWRRYRLEVPERGWITVCVPPAHKTSSGVRFAVALSVLGVVLWLGSGLLARRITRPLRQLERVAEDIGAGHWNARAKVPGHDELGRLAQAINEMAGRIRTQLDDQSTLLAAVSHELRTPLGHLRLLAELAGTEDLPLEERRRALEEIDAEVQEMDDLVGELLASSRLEFGSLQLQEIAPVEIAARALARAGLPAEALEVQAGLPVVRADATLVARALSNLVRNAQIHGAGLERLVVRPRNGGVAFEVEDLGPGISEEDRERIFRPFHRGHESKSGLGLGLALVSRIAEVHAGRAYAEARAEGGARVGFTLRIGQTLV